MINDRNAETYSERVRELEAEGLDTSDAQGVAEAEGYDPADEPTVVRPHAFEPGAKGPRGIVCKRCHGPREHRAHEVQPGFEGRTDVDGSRFGIAPKPCPAGTSFWECGRPEGHVGPCQPADDEIVAIAIEPELRLSPMARRVTDNKQAARRLVWEVSR